MEIRLATTSKDIVAIPLPVLALIAFGHAQHDVNAEVRGWGSEYLGNGVTVGLDHYSVTNEQIEDPALGRIDCVRVTKRPGFWTGEPGATVELLIPFDHLRKPLTVEMLVCDVIEGQYATV